MPFSLDDEDDETELPREDGPAFARPPARTAPAMLYGDKPLAEREPARNASPSQRTAANRFSEDPTPPVEEWPIGDTAKAPLALPGDPPARFLPRALAFVIDLMVLGFMDGALLLVTLLAVALARRIGGPSGADPADLVRALFTAGQIGLLLGYFAVLHTRGGQTLGKALVGLRVIAQDGTPLELRQSILRAAAYTFSALPLGAGFLLATLPARRALHDYLVGSCVVRVGAR